MPPPSQGCYNHYMSISKMGYHSEQSIINGRDKVPLLFNAMRNQIYRELESAMAAEGIRLQYGISKLKDASKDSGKNNEENQQRQHVREFKFFLLGFHIILQNNM